MDLHFYRGRSEAAKNTLQKMTETKNNTKKQILRINFTKASINDIPTESSDKNYFDTGVNGLYLIARSSGAKVFWVRGRINGIDRKIKIGAFPDVSVEMARNKAKEYIGKIAFHEDPVAERLRIKNDLTFGEMFKKFLEEYAKLHKKPRSWQGDVSAFKNHLSHLANKKASLITKEDVSIIFTKIANKGHKVNANRVLEKIKAIFNYAINHYGWQGNNPANGIKKFKEKSRDRILLPNETSKFFRALESEQNRTVKDFILVALLTGIRKNNILSMRWEDIEFDAKPPFWLIEETKNGNPQTVSIIPILVEMLNARKELLKKNGLHNSPFVFPGSGKSGYFQDPKKAWARILAKADLEDNLTIHDLRRTIATVLSDNQVNAETIRNILGHKSRDVASIYSRTRLPAKLIALEEAGEQISEDASGINKWWV